MNTTVAIKAAGSSHCDPIRDLVARIDLIALVGETAGDGHHTKDGAVMFRCPNGAGHTHGDKNKSFHVKTINGRQRWRCWANCRPVIGNDNAGGDALDYVIWHYGYTRADAIRCLRTRDGSHPTPPLRSRLADTSKPVATPPAPREIKAPPTPTGLSVPADIEADYLGRYCGWRGWPLEVAKRHGLTVVVDDHGRYWCRHPFMVPTASGPIMFGWQDRTLDKTVKPKWKAPANWAPVLWGVDSFATATVPIVVICEGPADGLTASYVLEGYNTEAAPAVVAVPGVTTWRTDWNRLFAGYHVVTAGDPDHAGDGLNERLAVDLKETAASVHRADRSLLTTDLTTALSQYGPDYVAAALMAPLVALGVTQ